MGEGEIEGMNRAAGTGNPSMTQSVNFTGGHVTIGHVGHISNVQQSPEQAWQDAQRVPPRGAAPPVPAAPTPSKEAKEEIEARGKDLLKRFNNRLTQLTGCDGIVYNVDLEGQFIEWNIFTPIQRTEIKIEKATKQPMLIFECLKNRTGLEVVLFAKALIATHQVHCLKESEKQIVDAIPLATCQELRKQQIEEASRAR